MKGDAIRLVWRKGAVLLALVSQSCSSSVAFLSGPSLLRPNAFIHPSQCLFVYMSQINPNDVVIPKRTPNTIVKRLSYITVDKQVKDVLPLFGGCQSWKQREESFKLNATTKTRATPR